MCSAVARRAEENGTTSSSGAGSATAEPVLAGAAGDEGRATAASTSARVMRPSRPEPVTWSGVRPCSSRRRSTTGERFGRTEVSSSRGPRGGAVVRIDRSASWGSGAAPSASVAPPMRASTVPTGTVSPSATSTDRSTPAWAAGTSVSTLSVETSKRGSSTATSSPWDFNHRVTVPSTTVSPSCGMVTCSIGAPRGDACHHFARAGARAAAHVSPRSVADRMVGPTARPSVGPTRRGSMAASRRLGQTHQSSGGS